MGNSSAKENSYAATEPKQNSTDAAMADTNSGDLITMKLQHPGHCTGMFWRGDPYTKQSPPSNDNWPRNGALLRGTGPHEVKGEKYFKVAEIQQAGKTGFQRVPEGTWMLYEQGGPLLHKV